MNVCLNSICVSHSESLKNSHSYRTPHSNIMRRIYWKITKLKPKNLARIFFGNNLGWLEYRALKYAWWDYLKSIGLGQLPTSCTEQCCPTIISSKHRWVSVLNQSVQFIVYLLTQQLGDKLQAARAEVVVVVLVVVVVVLVVEIAVIAFGATAPSGPGPPHSGSF